MIYFVLGQAVYLVLIAIGKNDPIMLLAPECECDSELPLGQPDSGQRTADSMQHAADSKRQTQDIGELDRKFARRSA